ncbi:hypothetical protein [Rhodococcoides yunnanense]|uniref:hypothetical protein n=1 Tax=Rhodococcoides yunnanense TaxID=278209 RepID=UPI000AE3EFA3|nr:hypothetical protein [Rhodococcus yunnanensis]
MTRKSTANPIASATGPGGAPESKVRTTHHFRRHALAVAAGLASLAAVCIVAFSDTDDDASAPESTRGTAVTTAPPTTFVATGPDCSMPRGNQSSATGVIAAFEHAYYVQRSGSAAHALVSPHAPAGAPFTVVANLDSGIATVAENTTYCLDIDPVDSNVHRLTLTESGPDGPGVQYRQRITTDEVDGHYVITSIDQA